METLGAWNIIYKSVFQQAMFTTGKNELVTCGDHIVFVLITIKKVKIHCNLSF